MVGIAAEVCTDGSVRGSVWGFWYRTEVNGSYLKYSHGLVEPRPYLLVPRCVLPDLLYISNESVCGT